MLLKEDKKHRCYHYFDLLENLREMPADEFAKAIKGKGENLQSKTAFDLLFKDATHFKSIQSFRECLMNKVEDIDHIYALPIMLLDPAPVASDRKYKYALELCPKTLRSKAQIVKSVRKQKYNLTTGQCKPIFSSYNIYRHYLTTE